MLDGEFHMFVLEGIAKDGIERLWTRLPRPPESGTYETFDGVIFVNRCSTYSDFFSYCFANKLLILELKEN